MARLRHGTQTAVIVAPPVRRSQPLEGVVMLHYAVVFLVIALIAAVFGFGGIAASAAGIAQILFIVFIVLAIASFLLGTFKRR